MPAVDSYDDPSAMTRSLFAAVLPKKSAAPQASSQSGQVGVVILLMMAVILTVGLSVVSRTTQDVFLANQTSDSARVFNAAESGLDQAVAQLQTSIAAGQAVPVGTQTITVNDTTVNFNIGQSNVMESRIFEGNSVMIRTTNNAAGLPSGGSNLRVDWSRATFDADCSVSPQQPASLLVTIYSANGANTDARTLAIGGCNRGDGFAGSNSSGAVAGYRFWANIPLQAGDLFARIKPLYADTHMVVNGSGLTLPTEAYTITAEGRNQTGNETRKIQVNQSLPTAPSVMDYVLYSGTTIAK